MVGTDLVLRTSSPDSGPSGLPKGRTEPRIYTRPLVTGPPGPCGCGCALDPSTSDGFAVAEFADVVLKMPLDPWERWVSIHGMERLPDGRPRFRHLLIIVARQNGKTHLLVVLTLFWLFVDKVRMIVGTSTNLEYAKEPWAKVGDFAEDGSYPFVAHMPKNGVRRGNNAPHILTLDGCRYRIAASDRRGGRSLSIDRLIQDELREQRNWDAWNAAVPAMGARPHAQNWMITNQGDATSIVLNAKRTDAMAYIEHGTGDARLGLFEYSAPDGAEIDDVDALAQANPNAGYRLDWDDLLGQAAQIKASGDVEQENGFRTERMCQAVVTLDAAVNPAKWIECATEPEPLADLRARLAVCLDVSPDGLHATLVAAAMIGTDRVRVEVVRAWDGADAVTSLRRELRSVLTKVKPARLGYFGNGPAAALAADLKLEKPKTGPKDDRPAWLRTLGTTVDQIGADSPSVCMGFAADVLGVRIAHPDDALLNAHVTAAERMVVGDRWVMARRGAGHIDAAYAVAGAVFLAKTMPPPVGRPRLIKPRASTR